MTIARLATASLLLVSLLACRPSPSARSSEPSLVRLCGSWHAGGDIEIEERWRLVEGGLAGESVAFDAEGREQLLERFAIDLRERDSTYRAHPLGADHETAFAQIEARASDRGGLWVWSNPNHDFPQRIEYELVDADRLIARISGAAGAERLEWTFERVAPCPTP